MFIKAIEDLAELNDMIRVHNDRIGGFENAEAARMSAERIRQKAALVQFTFDTEFEPKEIAFQPVADQAKSIHDSLVSIDVDIQETLSADESDNETKLTLVEDMLAWLEPIVL